MSKDILMQQEKLINAAMAFSAEANNMRDVEQKLVADVKTILDTGWQGKAANAFAGEFKTKTQPSIVKFYELLNKISKALLAEKDRLMAGDEKASSRFSGN